MKNFLNRRLIRAAAMLLLSGLSCTNALAGIYYPNTDGAFWVVESNNATKDYTIIKFYDAQHQQIYEERLEGKYLDITKRKHIKMLNKSLKMLENNSLIAGQLKKYQQKPLSLAVKREL